MANLKLNFDEYIPLRDIVFKTLREAIITGDLKPGERLMEIKLANELGVSRTPVREAIRKLELEGLVTMTARRGAEVAPINKKDMKEVLEIRRVLESLACQLACQKCTADDIKKLNDTNKNIARAIKEQDIEQITKLDVLFHDQINDMAGNNRLINILHLLKEHIFRYRLEYIREIENKDSIVDEHKKIISELNEKNEKAAVEAVEHHIQIQEKYILSILEKELEK